MPPLTAQDYTNLASAGAQIFGGLAGGASASKDRDLQAEENAYQREADARNLQMQWTQTLMNNQANRSLNFAQLSPLGAEQRLVQQNAMRLGAYGGLQNRQMPRGAFNPFVGMNLSSFGQDATAAAIGERRKALAGIDPNFQFGSMGAYGLSGPGTLSAEEQVAAYARDAASQRMAQENEMFKMLSAQYNQATGRDAEGNVKAAIAPPKKKTSVWKKIAKVALAAAPIIAAPFTGGASLLATGAIGALAGAGAGALDGGLKGALMGGVMGAIPMGSIGGAGSAAAREAAKRGVAGALKESVGSAIKRAVLNPQAIAKMAGAGIGGKTGAALQLASGYLKGPTAHPLTALGKGMSSPASLAPKAVDVAKYLPGGADAPVLPSWRSSLDLTSPSMVPPGVAPAGNYSASARPQAAVPRSPVARAVLTLTPTEQAVVAKSHPQTSLDIPSTVPPSMDSRRRIAMLRQKIVDLTNTPLAPSNIMPYSPADVGILQRRRLNELALLHQELVAAGGQ